MTLHRMRLQDGHDYFEAKTPREQSQICCELFDVALRASRRKSYLYKQLLIAGKYSWLSWTAKSVFSAIRTRTLRYEARQLDTQLYSIDLCLSLLAENTAKVIYNSTGPMAPFDEDSAAWVFPCITQLAEAVVNPDKLLEEVAVILDAPRNGSANTSTVMVKLEIYDARRPIAALPIG